MKFTVISPEGLGFESLAFNPVAISPASGQRETNGFDLQSRDLNRVQETP